MLFLVLLLLFITKLQPVSSDECLCCQQETSHRWSSMYSWNQKIRQRLRSNSQHNDGKFNSCLNQMKTFQPPQMMYPFYPGMFFDPNMAGSMDGKVGFHHKMLVKCIFSSSTTSWCKHKLSWLQLHQRPVTSAPRPTSQESSMEIVPSRLLPPPTTTLNRCLQVTLFILFLSLFRIFQTTTNNQCQKTRCSVKFKGDWTWLATSDPIQSP